MMVTNSLAQERKQKDGEEFRISGHPLSTPMAYVQPGLLEKPVVSRCGRPEGLMVQ